MKDEPKTQPRNNPQAATSQPAIFVDQLSKTYSDGLIFRSRFEALKDVSFTVNQGEIFGLLGPNGAGKTTFLKILLGIIRKTSGEATMLGFPAGSREGRKQVGYLPEHLRMPAHLTGFQALEYYGNLSNVPTRIVRQKQDELLETVGLAERAKDGVKKYSKGMLQRLGLAQALLHDPRLLVLDEPTDGLDPRARAEMRQVIRDLRERGVTIFLNSHLLQEVEMVCDRVAILDKGNLRYCGSVDQIAAFVQDLAIAGETENDAAIPASIAGAHTADGGNGAKSKDAVIEIAIEGDDPDAIHQCFQGTPFEIKTNLGTRFVVRASFTNQADIDSLIDRLRASQISIISLDRPRVSLEDAFLKIVQ